MKLSSQIKPISYLKAHAAEIVRTLVDQQEPLIITQNGEAKVVIQDIDTYEQMQEPLRCSRSSHWVAARSKRVMCNPPPMSLRGFGNGDRLADVLPGSVDR